MIVSIMYTHENVANTKRRRRRTPTRVQPLNAHYELYTICSTSHFEHALCDSYVRIKAVAEIVFPVPVAPSRTRLLDRIEALYM